MRNYSRDAGLYGESSDMERKDSQWGKAKKQK